MTLPARFWAKVNKNGPMPESCPHLGSCWQWTAGRSTGGYGKFGLTRTDIRYTHRLVYEALVGSIPDGHEIDHLCRNRLCCNPSHLEAVTHDVNMLRSVRTHCKHGHPFDEANTYVGPSGRRWCRACGAARARDYRAAASSHQRDCGP